MNVRVAITGIGTISSSGVGLEVLWRDCLEGRSGIGPITAFDVAPYKTRIAAQAPPLEGLDQHFDGKLLKRTDSFANFALYAAKIALDQSGLVLDGEVGDETGVLIGSGIGGMQTWEKQFQVLLNAVGDFQQDVGACGGIGLAPGVCCGVRGIQCQFDVFSGRAGGLGVDLATHRRDDIKVLALDGWHEFAADEVVVLGLVGDLGASGAGGCVNGHVLSPVSVLDICCACCGGR